MYVQLLFGAELFAEDAFLRSAMGMASHTSYLPLPKPRRCSSKLRGTRSTYLLPWVIFARDLL